MPAVPDHLALAVMFPLMAAWTLVVAALRALDAALAMWLADRDDLDERGAWS